MSSILATLARERLRRRRTPTAEGLQALRDAGLLVYVCPDGTVITFDPIPEGDDG